MLPVAGKDGWASRKSCAKCKALTTMMENTKTPLVIPGKGESGSRKLQRAPQEPGGTDAMRPDCRSPIFSRLERAATVCLQWDSLDSNNWISRLENGRSVGIGLEWRGPNRRGKRRRRMAEALRSSAQKPSPVFAIASIVLPCGTLNTAPHKNHSSTMSERTG